MPSSASSTLAGQLALLVLDRHRDDLALRSARVGRSPRHAGATRRRTRPCPRGVIFHSLGEDLRDLELRSSAGRRTQQEVGRERADAARRRSIAIGARVIDSAPHAIAMS